MQRDNRAGERPASEPVIRIDDLHMSYGPFEAVRGIGFEVRRGEILAFLGPNGAGKTTTMEIMEGYRKRTSGAVTVLGEDPGTAGPDWRSRIGVVLQESEPESELTVRECLSLYAGYYPKPRAVDETADLVGLGDKRNVRCGRLSGGLRRRLDVALSLIGDPELVFLDEPTTGFDPSARHTAWDVVANLRTLGKTILLTTHYMDEAEHLADWIVVIAAGRIVAEGTAATLGGRDTASTVIRFTMPEGFSAARLPPEVSSITTTILPGPSVELETSDPLPVLGILAGWAANERLDVVDLEVSPPSLEDVYLQLIQSVKP
jgi:ABC-2 type transport system ATP-binding protein